jgi:ketosteroid isomerase-like protein/regulator of replication initiation timing
MSKLNKVRAILAKMLQGFGNVTTDRGILAWDGDEDLKEGNEVFIEDAEGNRTAAEDGDYRTMDNKVIVVVDGKVAEIKDPEAEVESEFVETDKGKLMWDNEDRDLQAGDAVYVKDSEGNRVPAPDGDYTTEDGKVIKVADGKVAEIVDPRAEVAEEKYGRKETDKGELLWEGEEDLKAGNPVFVESEEGLKPAPDGDYETGDGKVIKVAEGVVAEIVDKEAEVADQPSEEMKALQEENASLKAENEAVKAEVEKLRKTPAAKPAHQEFSSSAELGKTGNKRLDNLARILSAK